MATACRVHGTWPDSPTKRRSNIGFVASANRGLSSASKGRSIRGELDGRWDSQQPTQRDPLGSEEVLPLDQSVGLVEVSSSRIDESGYGVFSPRQSGEFTHLAYIGNTTY